MRWLSLGSRAASASTPTSWPALADTISWEILAGISARVPRLYLRDGAAVAQTTLNERMPALAEEAASPAH